MKPRPYIRLATREDIAAIMDLLRSMHAEIGTLSLSEPKVEKRLSELIEDGCFLVAEVDDAIAACLGIVEGEPDHSDERVLSDWRFYVLPQYRSSRVGDLLLAVMREQAKQRKLQAYITVLDIERAGKRGRVASIHGFVPAGYVVRLN